MAAVLVISSMVARGHVGLSAAAPILQCLGFETVCFPTVVLSNHPGHARFAGLRILPSDLTAMFDALADNEWLGEIDAVLTGYFPSPEHVAVAAGIIERLKAARPDALICCDPVLGDHPEGLYVTADVAAALRARLLPLSEIITPNAFELAWLSGQPVASESDAITAAASLARRVTLATSVPAGTSLANVALDTTGAWSTQTARLPHVPHGTGDAMSAAFLAALLSGQDVPGALAQAAGRLDVLVSRSSGAGELQLVASQPDWTSARPSVVSRVSMRRS